MAKEQSMDEDGTGFGRIVLVVGAWLMLLIGVISALLLFTGFKTGIVWVDKHAVMTGNISLIYHLIFAALVYGMSRILHAVSLQLRRYSQEELEAVSEPGGAEVLLDISVALLIVLGFLACVYYFPKDTYSGNNPQAGIAVLMYCFIFALMCYGVREVVRQVGRMKRIVRE